MSNDTPSPEPRSYILSSYQSDKLGSAVNLADPDDALNEVTALRAKVVDAQAKEIASRQMADQAVEARLKEIANLTMLYDKGCREGKVAFLEYLGIDVPKTYEVRKVTITYMVEEHAREDVDAIATADRIAQMITTNIGYVDHAVCSSFETVSSYEYENGEDELDPHALMRYFAAEECEPQHWRG